MLSATQANMIMVQKGLHCFVGLEGSLVCFFFIICMANELAWAVCPGLYICTWFFTSEKKSFYLVSQKKKKKHKTKQRFYKTNWLKFINHLNCYNKYMVDN